MSSTISFQIFALSLLVLISGCSENNPPAVKTTTAEVAETPAVSMPSGKEKQVDTDTSPAPSTDTDQKPVFAGETTAAMGALTTVELVAKEGVSLKELVVASGIKDKKPLDPRDSYTAGEYEKIAAWMMFDNPLKIEDSVHVSFLHVATGKERGDITVSIGPQKNWRTWAFSRTVQKPGVWHVLVRGSDGALLGRAPFEILPAL